MAVKPYLGAIFPPTGYKHKKDSDEVPDTSLALDWIHGYSAQEGRDNVFFSSSGEIVFFAAAVCVSLDVTSEVQRFHREHTDDILTMAMHPNRKIFASGEIGKKPKIILWDVDTMKTITIFEGAHVRGICQLAFDPSGARLASIGKWCFTYSS